MKEFALRIVSALLQKAWDKQVGRGGLSVLQCVLFCSSSVQVGAGCSIPPRQQNTCRDPIGAGLISEPTPSGYKHSPIVKRKQFIIVYTFYTFINLSSPSF